MPPNPTDQRVAANVRAEMARLKITQAALAPTVRMTQQALSRRLSGQTPFTVEELGRVGESLNVSLTTLIGEAVAS